MPYILQNKLNVPGKAAYRVCTVILLLLFTAIYALKRNTYYKLLCDELM